MQDRLLAQEKHATDASDAAAASNAHTNPNSPTPTNATEEKIQAIRASLIQRSEVEEETEIASHIAENIKLAKEKKEFPEHFLPRQKQTGTSHSTHAATAKKHKKKRSVLRNLFPKRGDSVGEKIRKCIFLISSTVFLICLILIGLYFYELHQARSLYDQVGASYYAKLPALTEPATSDDMEYIPLSEAEKVYHILPGAQDLLDINPEVAGWLSIPDTQIDYPLMHHDNDTPGDEYYLHRDIHQDYSYPGSIFLDYRCNFDRVGEDGTLDVENSDNLIIYGHNMRDLSMFGSLKYYETDSSYYEAHPLIRLNSNYEQYTYKIFAYYIADAEDTTDTRFDYWNSIQFADETAFYAYVNEIKRRTLRITNVDVQYGDQLLTLSTCNSAFDTARLVIMARRVRDGEDANAGTTGSYANPNIKWPNVYYLTHNDAKYDPNAEFVPYGS